MTIEQAVSRFGAAAKAKLANAAATGEPEDQLRAPFEQLLADVAAVLGLHHSARDTFFGGKVNLIPPC